ERMSSTPRGVAWLAPQASAPIPPTNIAPPRGGQTNSLARTQLRLVAGQPYEADQSETAIAKPIPVNAIPDPMRGCLPVERRKVPPPAGTTIMVSMLVPPVAISRCGPGATRILQGVTQDRSSIETT